jgi:hypothetical protein
MQFLIFGHELFFGFFVGGVRFRGFDGADLGALGCIMNSDALRAFVRVDFIGGVALTDRLIRALRLAGAATDTILGNLVSHVCNASLLNYEIIKISLQIDFLV